VPPVRLGDIRIAGPEPVEMELHCAPPSTTEQSGTSRRREHLKGMRVVAFLRVDTSNEAIDPAALPGWFSQPGPSTVRRAIRRAPCSRWSATAGSKAPERG
jgi:hypothetical protein